MHEVILPFYHTSSWRRAQLSTEYIFIAWYLIKHRDSLLLPLPLLSHTTICLMIIVKLMGNKCSFNEWL
jgi:hypothetical protein